MADDPDLQIGLAAVRALAAAPDAELSAILQFIFSCPREAAVDDILRSIGRAARQAMPTAH